MEGSAKMAKINKFIIINTIILLLLTGCSSNKRANYDSYYLKQTDKINYYQTSDNLNESNEKIIVTGQTSLETYDLDKCLTEISDLVNEYNGIIKSKNEGKYEYENYRYADMTIYIPADKFDEFNNELKEKGNVISTSYNSENVTQQYNDTESRLLSLKAQEERVRELYSSADSIENLLKIEERLSEITSEITSLQNSKNNYDLLISYSTLTISLKEVTTYSKVKDNFFNRLWNALKNSFNNFLATIQDILLFISNNIFTIAFVVIIFFILKKLNKKKQFLSKFKRKNKNENSQEQQG